MLPNDLKIPYRDNEITHPGQFYHLKEQLQWNINLRKHFDLEDEELWGNDEKEGLLRQRITIRQYKYILALMFSRDYFKLNEVMLQLGFKRKVVDETKTQTEQSPF